MAEATTDPVRLPPGPPLPKALQAVAFLGGRHRAATAGARRYGPTFSVNLPIFGQAVVTGDRDLIKDLFLTSGDLVGRPSNLGSVLGPGSTFSLDGDEHRERRKLLVPPFHGKRMHGYEAIIEEEVLRECATWPHGQEFATLQPMMRITLNAILRAVFGAQGSALDELRRLLPPMVPLASRMAVLPTTLRRDLGPWSPWGRVQGYRRRYDEIIAGLIADARSGAGFDDRADVLALLLRARYDEGAPISDSHVADELLTLLAAGHETTATTLAWAIERLRRHPRLLSRLTAEIDAGGSELLQATIWEVQRTRPVVEATSRVTRDRIRLGEWVIPERTAVIASIGLAHESQENFNDPKVFNPDRFLGANPDIHSWIPFGGGIRRCIGAAFANMEMNVTLSTLLREFEFGTTYSPGERRHSRGVATAPADGGRAVVFKRNAPSAVAHTTGETVVEVGRGIQLCYDQTGDRSDPPLVLIAGLGQQKHSWPDDFVAALAGRGFHVTRFDNRDAGRSTHMRYPPPNPVEIFRGGDRRRQYHLGDMARDTVGLLDALGYRDAHLVGISMGAMIAQTVAVQYPGRVRSLTSLMSTTGASAVGRPRLSTWRRMLTPAPRTREAAMDRAVEIFRHIGSHGYPFDEQAVREKAGIDWDRDPSPHGVVRQLAAVFASGDRTAELRHIDVPALVIHGDRDRMIHPTGGAATARAIPGARLETIVGLGHDLPIGAWDRIVDLIVDHIQQAALPPAEAKEHA